MSEDTPSLSEVITNAIRTALEGIWTALPAKVVEFDAATQKASVQPMVKRPYIDEGGNPRTERLPVINEVPIVFLGMGPFRVTVPVKKDQFVLLVFCDYSIQDFMATGNESDPGESRIHSLNDAIAIAGLRSFSDPVADFPTDRMSIGKDGECTIEIDSEIRLGGNDASDRVALISDLTALKSWLDTHTHPAPGGATSAPTPLSPAPTGATKVKAK